MQACYYQFTLFNTTQNKPGHPNAITHFRSMYKMLQQIRIIPIQKDTKTIMLNKITEQSNHFFLFVCSPIDMFWL